MSPVNEWVRTRPFPETRALARTNPTQTKFARVFFRLHFFQTNDLIQSHSLTSQCLNYLPLNIRVLVNNVYVFIKWHYKYSNIKTNQQFCKGEIAHAAKWARAFYSPHCLFPGEAWLEPNPSKI